MPEDLAIFSLHVSKAFGIPLTIKREAPKAFVKVEINDQSLFTRTVERSRNPVWNDKIQFSAPKDLSSTLSLHVKHDARVWRDPCLGEIELPLRELAELTKKSTVVTLKLKNPSGKDDGKDRGYLVLSLISDRPEDVGSEALKFARIVTGSSGVSRASDLSDAFSAPDSAIGLVDSPPDFVSALGNVVSQLSALVKIIDVAAKVHPFANIAWTITSSVYHAVEGQLQRDSNLVDLLKAMEEVYSFVDTLKNYPNKIKVLENTILMILKQTVECSIFIREYSGHGFGGRLIRQTLSNDGDTIDKFTKKFAELKESFDTAATLQTTLVSIRASDELDRLVRIQDLHNLHPVHMDASERVECQPDTRLESVKFVTEWLMTPSEAHNALWLYGNPGCGKSALATTIASYFRQLGRLGAFLFFDQSEGSEPKYFVRTLAYQLGISDSRIGTAISAAIATNPRIDESPLPLQFSTLILEPLASLRDTVNEGPMVVVIDALDQCADPRARRSMLRLLAAELKNLPPFLRFLITSRREHDLVTVFKVQENIHSQEFHVDEEKNMQDIRFYLRRKLAEVRLLNEDLDLGQDWPREDIIVQLSEKSGGLFSWCSSAVTFIEKGQDPDEGIAIILRDGLPLATPTTPSCNDS